MDAYLLPHCDADWKRESEIRSLRHIPKVGLSLLNCSAIEIVDDAYCILHSLPADSSFQPYVLRSYWNKGQLFEETLDASETFRPLESLRLRIKILSLKRFCKNLIQNRDRLQ